MLRAQRFASRILPKQQWSLGGVRLMQQSTMIKQGIYRVDTTDAPEDKFFESLYAKTCKWVNPFWPRKGTVFGLQGYQWPPLIAMGMIPLLTKELVPLDPTFLHASIVAVEYWVLWTFWRDTRHTRRKYVFKRNFLRRLEAIGIRVDHLKRFLLLEEFALSHPQDLRTLYSEENRINQMAVDYQNLKHQLDTRNAIISKLRTLQSLEEDVRRKAVDALSTRAAEYVRDTFVSAPSAVKNKAIDLGIKNMVSELSSSSVARMRSKPPAPLPADDPVKLLFDEFLSKPRSPQDLGVENSVQKFLAKEKLGGKH